MEMPAETTVQLSVILRILSAFEAVNPEGHIELRCQNSAEWFVNKKQRK